MSHTPIQLALRRFLDFAAPAPLQESRSPFSPSERVDRLIALAAAFAGELRAVSGEALAARPGQFHQAVGRLDHARATIRQSLEGLAVDEVYVPDLSAPPDPVRRLFLNDGDGVRVDFVGGPPNAVPGIISRLVDVWDVVWDIPAAYRDVDDLRAAGLPPELSTAVEVWRASLREFTVADERGQLFGAYLLERCSRGTGAEVPAAESEDLHRRLAGDVNRFARVVSTAAEYLAAALLERRGDAPAAVTTERPEAGGSGASPRFHGPLEARPEEFKQGPLSGSPKTLAGIICPVYGVGKNARALYKLGAEGRIWIVQYDTKRLEVYFSVGSQFEQCERRFQESLNRQQHTGKRKN